MAETRSVADRTYSVVRGFPEGDALLRMAEDGTVYVYLPDKNKEGIWAAFGAPEGEKYETAIGMCNTSAVIRSKAFKAEVPVGQFDNILAIDYPPSGCADAGITSELYLPYVGLLQRTTTSFAGPVVYDLVYARLNNGLTIITAPEQSLTISLDNTVYAPGSQGNARLTLRNTQARPVTLTFPSAQRYDLSIRNEKGDIVYTWSRDKLFAQVFGTLEVTGEKSWVVQFPIEDLPEGKYTIEAWLATQGPQYRGRAVIEVKKAP